jgi:hypothetical protein
MKKLKTFEKFLFEEYDIVISVEQIGNIPIGTKGTIVHLYDDYTFVVEFFDEEHNTISVETVTKKQIKKYEKI